MLCLASKTLDASSFGILNSAGANETVGSSGDAGTHSSRYYHFKINASMQAAPAISGF